MEGMINISYCLIIKYYLAAQQLQKMLGEKIHIVPSVNPMEGLAAAMAFMDNIGIEENLNEMSKRVQQIKQE